MDNSFVLIFICVPIIKAKKGIPVFEPEIEKSSFGLTNSCASDQYAKDVNID